MIGNNVCDCGRVFSLVAEQTLVLAQTLVLPLYQHFTSMQCLFANGQTESYTMINILANVLLTESSSDVSHCRNMTVPNQP